MIKKIKKKHANECTRVTTEHDRFVILRLTSNFYIIVREIIVEVGVHVDIMFKRIIKGVKDLKRHKMQRSHR